MQLRVARSWGVEPEAFWRDWSPRSRRLAIALQVMEDETGAEGFPLEMEMDDDNAGWFVAEEHVNHAVAARDQWLKDHPKPDPGTRLVVRYTRPEGGGVADRAVR